MAMLFNRKTGASFLVALLAAGLPCTVFAGPQEQQAKVIQAMQQAPLVVKNPPVLGLKVDRADVYQLPRNFRMATDEYKGMTKSGIMPTRQGLEKLHASASSCFSEKELEAVLAAVPVSADKFYDIDLRGESHGYLDGTAVSWYADHDWGNDDRKADIILPLEKEQLGALAGQKACQVYRFDDNKNVLLEPVLQPYSQVRTEEEMVRQHGANYFRLTLQDHFRPEDSDVDHFVAFYKQLPQDAWLHYHCYAGMGRTTIFFVMHDILKNARSVSFDDIIQRQKLIGIVDLSDIPEKKRNYGRKAYIERYQFVAHFYDYVKENPKLEVPYSVWAKKHKVNLWEPDYSGYIWRIDAENKESLPRNFRTADGPFKQDMPADKVGKGFTQTPSRQGLDSLAMSGSAEFSAGEFKALQQALKAKTQGPVYVLDLRQESHGLFNGHAVSWYGDRDWGNVGKTRQEVLCDESKRLHQAKGKSLLLAKLDKKKLPANPHKEKIDKVMSEQQLVEGAGWHYLRLTDTDHVWPAAANIEKFIAFTQSLPQDAWLHFHCQAGKGRTTAYMAMYDMMKNPEVPLRDILSRQYLLGGAYVAYESAKAVPGQWKADYYHQKARMIEKFYRYVQAAHKDGFSLKWSQWLREHEDI
ncbi:hypothetical protein [Selenomonas sp. ND2010]|uniref:hypothetical protein n=1 Tax=Selenomonas sp. ND2010 TaxID=1410618 RepID=UPI000A3EDE06|nr:hypothetical protein [Selenomonas sp. ND2010]